MHAYLDPQIIFGHASTLSSGAGMESEKARLSLQVATEVIIRFLSVLAVGGF
jgi:hypothetical protein